MKPFLAKGYAKRKLHTGNQSVQFDEEREVERPLFYSTEINFQFMQKVNPLRRSPPPLPAGILGACGMRRDVDNISEIRLKLETF